MDDANAPQSDPWWVVFARIAFFLLLIVVVGERQVGEAAIALAVLVAGYGVARAIRGGK
ncbi:MAG: hypothetical protein WD875_18440 [Pirellulales bacterium]